MNREKTGSRRLEPLPSEAELAVWRAEAEDWKSSQLTDSRFARRLLVLLDAVERRPEEEALLTACRNAMIVTTAPDDFLAEASEREIRRAIIALRLVERGD